MTTDPAARLARLRRKLAAETDLEERADLEAAIAALESQQAGASHSQTLGNEAQAGAAVAGNVSGGVIAPLFTDGGSGNYIASVINVYATASVAAPADYDAALRRYLTDLYDQHATLDMRGIDERQVDPPLRDLYISLTLSQPQHEDLRGGVRRFMARVSALVKPQDAPDVDIGSHTVDWPTALQTHRRIAVIGKPGSGKTTLLHYTAVRLAEALARDDQDVLAETGLAEPLVPVLLPLRELGTYLDTCDARELSGRNPRLLLDCLATYYAGRDLDLPVDFFRRLCDEGRALLLLDGLDEVASTNDRQIVSALIGAFAVRYPRCRYIVTARVAAYVGDAQVGHEFAICTVNDLDDSQQQRFIANWSRCIYRLIQPTADVAKVTREANQFNHDLWDALARNEAVHLLVPNPLLLTIVAIVFYNRNDLPENRAGLYEACVAVLLRGGRGKVDPVGKARERYSGVAGAPMSLDEKRELLAAIAYSMHCGGEQAKLIHHDQLVQVAAVHLDRSVSDRVEAERRARAFVRELPVHIGLLDELEQHMYGFSHLSFQEFLAARHIADHDDLWEALLDQYRETWWREVILLCAGYLPQERCWRLLERLIERGSNVPERAQALALAADALAELERFKGQGRVRERVQDQALRILTAPPEKAPATARVACGRALAHVGDPREGVCTLPPALIQISTERSINGVKPDLEEAAREYMSEATKEPDRILINMYRFEVGLYPITNAQYKLFIDDGGYDLDAPWWDNAGRAWRQRSDKRVERLKQSQQRLSKHHPEFWQHDRLGLSQINHPVVGVSWYEAMAFCHWLTQHLHDEHIYTLPSSVAWEVTLGKTYSRIYHWTGNKLDRERANCDRLYGGTTAVGCFPLDATRQSVVDLVGNVWEWTRAWAPQQKSLIYGGSWLTQYDSLDMLQHLSIPLDSFSSDLGFRLVRLLPL